MSHLIKTKVSKEGKDVFYKMTIYDLTGKEVEAIEKFLPKIEKYLRQPNVTVEVEDE